MKPGPGSDAVDQAMRALFAAIASHDHVAVTRMLDQTPGLVTAALRVGASRRDPRPYFLTPIGHYVYSGDTALHVAAAAHDPVLARTLVAQGATVRARNRRGAEPLHYAANGGPSSDASAQRALINFLIDAGADPNAPDKGGVSPLHKGSMLWRSRRPNRQGCRPPTDEPEWLDPAPPGSPEHRQESLWI